MQQNRETASAPFINSSIGVQIKSKQSCNDLGNEYGI